MALQTQNLVMVGLGMVDDAPPTPLQPPLVNGVHLRWAFKRELGFPWNGFYLFRRPSQRGDPICASRSLGALKPGPLPVATLNTSFGQFSSDRSLTLTDDFPSSGLVEIDLSSLSYLRFTLPAGEFARWAEVRLGLREDLAAASACVNFRDRKAETVENPYVEQAVTFTVYERDDSPMSKADIVADGAGAGLACGFTMEIRLPCAADAVELTLTSFSEPAFVEAFDDNGALVAEARMNSPAGAPEALRLEGQAIARLVVHAPEDKTLLHELCFTCAQGEPGGPIRITGLLGDVPVVQADVVGQTGQVVATTLEFDAISAITIAGGPAALVDLCLVPASQGATAGWQPAPKFPAPMCLPVTHPSYPCSGGKPVDRPAAEARALGRVLYGPASDWAGASFGVLHDQLLRLVEGGPGGASMAQRFAAVAGEALPPDPNVKSPAMPRQYPLDLVLLGSLHPAVAQMLGLYWVDRTAAAGVAYDYLIVADRDGQAGGQAQKLLSTIQQTGFSTIDGYIVFNKKAEAQAALPAPQDLRAYALPAGTARAQGGDLIDAANNAGLRWRLDAAGSGAPPPGRALMYHVWRAGLGNRATPESPGEYDLLTKARPTLVAEPSFSAAPQRPSDWPPFALHFIDRGLADGWYSYQVSGIDIFGRHSPNSAAASWRQWTPDPVPRPWYYQDPPSDASIHPFAVRLLDTTPPPPPTGVEAYALDPSDPLLLRDAAYAAWQATLSPAERTTLVGLRVRWQWTEAHMRQAPDAREFRIYYHPGADPPANHAAATSWQERYYVVDYNAHVTTATDAAGRPIRRYEVLLPAAGDAFRASLPLNPTLADPIAYANIGVGAADDKTAAADAPQWASGRWGGRFGNEGRTGAPAKVFRVRRASPPAPALPADAERVYATPADYYSRSLYTYRWKPSANLKAHIFRALDDAIFKADWAQRPRSALSGAQTQFFPAATDPRWNAAKRAQVAIELNQLNGFGHDAAGAAQAIAYYRKLSDDALRVLAGLPGNERAFVQITVQPLDPADPATANRVGPDNPPNFALDPNLRAYVDTLDGRSSNRYFYRAAYVDGAHNRSPLSLAGPPVWLPNVTPPRAPVITSVLGGDRQITITWASNREADLAEYRVYRADDEAATRDLRLMALVHSAPAPPGDPAARPPSVAWTDSPLDGGARRFYRIVAVDQAGNISAPSIAMAGQAFRDTPPAAPAWVSALRTTGDGISLVQLTWALPEALETLVQRRRAGTALWTIVAGWLPQGTATLDDPTADPATAYIYRLRGRDAAGQQSAASPELTVPADSQP